ncbi:reverse transcriptase domain-containing protein, partial [Mycobacterium kansasii]
MLVADSSMKDISDLKRQLSRKFAMKDLGATKQILRMRIKRDKENNKLVLSQAEYIVKVLD